MFNEYLEYLLGEFVLKLTARGASGAAISAPSWALLLSYEHAMRKKAFTSIRKGLTFKEALRAAMEGPVTKERYFTTPMCLEATAQKRPAEVLHSQPGRSHADGQPSGGSKKGNSKSSKGKASGKGKGREKGRPRGKGREGAGSCRPEMNDGTKVCFKYNNPSVGCANTKCAFAHVCGICFAAGVPMFRCSHGGQTKVNGTDGGRELVRPCRPNHKDSPEP